eukprot:scaffold206197_cov32-Tisochrysis_lutea.AAC.2
MSATVPSMLLGRDFSPEALCSAGLESAERSSPTEPATPLTPSTMVPNIFCARLSMTSGRARGLAIRSARSTPGANASASARPSSTSSARIAGESACGEGSRARREENSHWREGSAKLRLRPGPGM